MKTFNNIRLVTTILFSFFLTAIGGLIIAFTLPNLVSADSKVYEATIIEVNPIDEIGYPMILSITLEDGSVIEVPSDFASDSYKAGDTIKVLYSKSKNVASSLLFSVIFLVVGIALILGDVIFVTITIVQHKKTNTTIDEAQKLNIEVNEELNESFDGEKYDFYPHTNNALNYSLDYVYGGNRYEAICEKNHFFGGYDYAFKDKETGLVKRHKISITVTRSAMEFDPINPNSYFKIDNVKIWDYFKSNQITIKLTSTKLTDIKFAVYYKNELLGLIESSSPKNGLISSIKYKGFYRITTKDDNVRIMFLVAFTLSRVEGIAI